MIFRKKVVQSGQLLLANASPTFSLTNGNTDVNGDQPVAGLFGSSAPNWAPNF